MEGFIRDSFTWTVGGLNYGQLNSIIRLQNYIQAYAKLVIQLWEAPYAEWVKVLTFRISSSVSLLRNSSTSMQESSYW